MSLLCGLTQEARAYQLRVIEQRYAAFEKETKALKKSGQIPSTSLELLASSPEQECNELRREVQYHAFDGSSSFVTNVSALLHEHFPLADFRYSLAAVMHEEGGFLRFAQRNDEGGHVLGAGTAGSLTKRSSRGQEEMTVPVITVDNYCEKHGLMLDMLKVDVEGYDLAVLLGAINQLSGHVWFLQFEWGGNK